MPPIFVAFGNGGRQFANEHPAANEQEDTGKEAKGCFRICFAVGGAAPHEPRKKEHDETSTDGDELCPNGEGFAFCEGFGVGELDFVPSEPGEDGGY